MLAEVLIRLASGLDTGLFGVVYPQVRMITTMSESGTRTFPGYNISTGQYRHVLEDSTGGVLYHRISGDITAAGRDAVRTTSCGNESAIVLEYPVRQVAFLPREQMQCSDMYSDEQLAMWLIKTTMETSLSGNKYNAQIALKSISLNPVSVLANEYTDYREMVDINYEWTYIALEWNIKIGTNLECLCDDTLY